MQFWGGTRNAVRWKKTTCEPAPSPPLFRTAPAGGRSTHYVCFNVQLMHIYEESSIESDKTNRQKLIECINELKPEEVKLVYQSVEDYYKWKNNNLYDVVKEYCTIDDAEKVSYLNSWSKIFLLKLYNRY
ncbi:hypothetical protein AVEN_66735-1 [Araneus ventricosus]|uniref:Uncharacterized protein n=1 Tax=Araneus ventricosus TaxID=182803 RepID=A0A4Y2HS00_ARAVE|nr:hypothetical protein AVEN_66735-1 [Araneus ventricosus]